MLLGWATFCWVGLSLSSMGCLKKTRALLELSLLPAGSSPAFCLQNRSAPALGAFLWLPLSCSYAPVSSCHSHAEGPQSCMLYLCNGMLMISSSKLLPGRFFFFSSVTFVYLRGPQPNKASHVQESTGLWHPCSAGRAFPSPSGSA